MKSRIMYYLTVGLIGSLFLFSSAYAIQIDGELDDWSYSDLIILDGYWGMTLGENPSYSPCSPIDGGTVPPGSDWTYLFNDGYDDSRDLVAFYMHSDNDTIYFRIDFFDLKYQAERSGGLDVYILVDSDGTSGETWLPDYTDCRTDAPWDIAICIYDSEIYSIKEGSSGQPELPVTLSLSFNAQMDALECSIPRSVFLEHGWDGETPLRFQVFTTRDGTNGGAGEIGGSGGDPGNSDLTDAFVDDDRGFSDGYLNGTFSAADGPPGQAHWAVMMHGNQPFANEQKIRARIDKSTDPEEPILGVGLYRALETAELTGQPVELHISGTLALAAQWAAPEFNDRIKRAVDNGLVDLVGGTFSEHIMPFFHGEVNMQSIRIGTETLQKIYGVTPEELPVFWIPERVARGDFHTDILNANALYGYHYKAVILDEFTHHHDWFGYDHVWNDTEGDDVPVDTDNDVHKIHEYNGIRIFFIDRYAQKWKTETMYPVFYDCGYEPSLQIGIRARLLDMAMASDPAQVMLCMEDWEDFAGEPYRAQASARNPDGFETVTRWIAAHPWINMTTTTAILNGEVDLDGDGSGDEWDTVSDTPLTDHLPPFYGLPMPPYWLDSVLPMDSYAWLRDSSEGNYGDDNPYPDPTNVDNDPRNDDWDDGYQNWYYGSDHEFSFADMVPALKGWQYDRGENGEYPANPLPNGKAFHGMWRWRDGVETTWEEGIIPETWAMLPAGETAYADPFWEYACMSYLSCLYETAWHDESTVRQCTGDDEDDDQKGILVSWVLPACNHLRDVAILAEAHDWYMHADSYRETVSEMKDVDLDGETELLLFNSHVFLVFENDGGRLVKAFSRSSSHGLTELTGASIAYADRGSEDENRDAFISIDPDPSINRVSCFRDEEYINSEYLISVVPGGAIFFSDDLKIRRSVTLPDDSFELEVTYSLEEPMKELNVEFGFSPNPYDTCFKGKSALETIGGPHGSYIGLKNATFGSIYLRFGDTSFVYADDLSRNRTCALTQRVIINVENGDTFYLGFGDPEERMPPRIRYAVINPNPYFSSQSTTLEVLAWTEGPVQEVMLYYGGTEFQPTELIPLLALHDDGQNGDGAAGDDLWGVQLSIPGAVMPSDRYILALRAESPTGITSTVWPYLHVMPGTAFHTSDTHENIPFLDRYLSEFQETLISKSNPTVTSGAESGNGAPTILGGVYYLNEVTSAGGQMQLYVIVSDPDGLDDIDEVRLMYWDIDLDMPFSDLGNGIYGLDFDWPAGIPEGDYILEVEVSDLSGNTGNRWPYWDVW